MAPDPLTPAKVKALLDDIYRSRVMDTDDLSAVRRLYDAAPEIALLYLEAVEEIRSLITDDMTVALNLISSVKGTQDQGWRETAEVWIECFHETRDTLYPEPSEKKP